MFQNLVIAQRAAVRAVHAVGPPAHMYNLTTETLRRPVDENSYRKHNQ